MPNYTEQCCKKCETMKPLTEFYANPYTDCKKCHNEYTKGWRLRNPELHRQYLKNSYRKMTQNKEVYEAYKKMKREYYHNRKKKALASAA